MRHQLSIGLISLFLVLNNFAIAQDDLDAQLQEIEPLPPIFGASGNKKITLNIREMPISDVLMTIADNSGTNIMVGKNVAGMVTLSLKDVSVSDAFEIILLANELAYVKKGDIIYVTTQGDYELQYGQRFDEKKKVKVIQLKYARAEDLLASLTQIQSTLGRIVTDAVSNTVVLIDTPQKIEDMEKFINSTDLPVETRIFNLNYAQAEKLQAKIQDVITKNIGRVKIDERTNKIAVTDYPAKLDEIFKMIAAFDDKTLQVLIDAQIIEIHPKDEFKMGVDWDFWLKKSLRLTASLPVGVDNKLSIGTAAAGGVPTEKEEYKGIIDFLRTIGDVKILSSPRIMALNNQEAKILVGSREPYITQKTVIGSGGPNVVGDEVTFVDVGIKLYVTPTISRDNFVTMKIKPEVSSASISSTTAGGKVPIVTTSEAETSVIVKDGVTIIIGGLTKEKVDKTTSRVPGLGRIPLLGNLFRNTSDVVEKTELVILLTPHILSGETSFTDFSQITPKDGAVVNLEDGKLVFKKTTSAPEENYSKNDDFAEYYQLISDRVKEQVFLDISPAENEKGMVKVVFDISKNGYLINEPFVSESSNLLLNSFAIEAVKLATPFPPIPDSLRKSEETFEIKLVFE